MWKPKEIIINEKVRTDPLTKHIISQCPNVPVTYVNSGKANHIVAASKTLGSVDDKSMLGKIIAGKSVLYIAPASMDVVDTFEMPDDRMMCPHFARLKFASNGCYYQCDWCYLKLTYRAAFPFITVRSQQDMIKERIQKKLDLTDDPVIFNSGEMADSLALEHLTRFGQEFIPWFGNRDNGYLFMLTKSDNIDDILGLDHNGHTKIAWSMNNEMVSRKFEIGAPAFIKRLEAAYKVQQAGYPVRVRLDPIVPFDGWKSAYAKTIADIFERIAPERITLGTLRFEEGFYKMRNTFFSTGPDLKEMMETMTPMFQPKIFPGGERPKVGKYSFSEQNRIEIFNFAINEIRKYSECDIALCKESSSVWKEVGLDLSHCKCVCQLDHADMKINDK